MTQTLKQNDRVSFSFSTRESGENVHLSYSTDLLAGESASDAMRRCRDFIMSEVARKAGSSPPADTAAPQAKRPNPMIFDPENPGHRMMAGAHFDIHRVVTPKRREFLSQNFLKGKPLDQIGAIIKAEVIAFKKTGGEFPPNVHRMPRRDS